MRRQLFFLSCFLGLNAFSFADTVEAGAELEDRDIQALREWINTKRQVSLKEIGGDLSISGEVRTEFQTTSEKRNGRRQRGGTAGFLPAQGFDIEVNLMFDYRTDRTWASVKLEFDNDAGVFSGTLNKIALERAYWGVRLLDADQYTFDIEAGRRFMSSIFDSKVQFGSFFDGILFRYDHAFEKIGDFYIHTGPFVVNDAKNQFAYIGEIGFLNILGTGFYTKISLIDWDTKHYEEEFVNNRFHFLNGQLTAGYRFRLESVQKIGVLYSAFIWNFLAKRLAVSDFKRANWAAYLGLSMGQLRKQWDWSFDINYQLVAAQAIPDFDVSSNGIGNANRSGFYTRFIRPLDGGGPSTPATAAGTTNYHGLYVTFDLLLTDKLDMQQAYMQSYTLDKDIGPTRRYRQYELEFIYSW